MLEEEGAKATPQAGGSRREPRGTATRNNNRSTTERDRRFLNSIQSTLNATRPVNTRRVKSNHLAEPRNDIPAPTNADEIVAKMAEMTIDKQCSAQDLRRLLTSREVHDLNDEVWSRVGTLLVDTAFRDGDSAFAVDMAVVVIEHEGFQASFAERMGSEMSSYALCPQIAKGSLLQVVALLLVASWPRPHARSTLDSNQVLFTVISSIKGWIITITDEEEDDTDMMSRCALGLAQICDKAQRRLWMKWPELVDEIYVAAEKALTSDLPLNREAKSALLDAFVRMHSWTARTSKSTCNAQTQTA